jgi:hypothetical protein
MNKAKQVLDLLENEKKKEDPKDEPAMEPEAEGAAPMPPAKKEPLMSKEKMKEIAGKLADKVHEELADIMNQEGLSTGHYTKDAGIWSQILNMVGKKLKGE